MRRGLALLLVFGRRLLVGAGHARRSVSPEFSASRARFKGPDVGQPILAADPLSSGSSRLKAGCGQDCPPHRCRQILRETGH
jgi:hypothetical protein